MITAEVEIYNLALNAIGARNNVSIPEERSREAEVCRLWYTVVRDQILSAAFWPSATAFQRLAVLKEREDALWTSGDPAPGFLFAYSVPTDMLRPRHLASFERFTLTTFPESRQAIMADEPQAILTYTKRQENISLWDAELQMAIVYGLAGNICMPLTGKPARARNLIEQANALIFAAREGAANTPDAPLEAIPDWIAARGYGGGFTRTRFLYPYGNSLSVTQANVN